MFQTSKALKRNVHSQVADRIGISIVRGDIVAGDALPSEMQICEIIDVSRTVVREAIRTLTGKGLVVSRPKSGTRVRPPEEWNQLDPDVLRWRLETSDMDSYLTKLFQLRCAVEPAAAALAAESAGEEDLARIRLGYEGMAAARTNEKFVVADIAFHQGIYFATRNEFFWPIAQMFEITLRQSLRSRRVARIARARCLSIAPFSTLLRQVTLKTRTQGNGCSPETFSGRSGQNSRP
ncbi:MAG: FadR/GntR family transcriptional regulator [Bradyrhizobium sp.]